MPWYHASPVSNLHEQGIRSGVRPTVCRRTTPYVYLGTIEYLFTQYFSYCPKRKYFIYEVNTDGLKLDANLPYGQVRHIGDIPPERVKLVDIYEVGYATA